MENKGQLEVGMTGEQGEENGKLLFLKENAYDESYIQGLITKATPNWKGIEADEWLRELRNGDAFSIDPNGHADERGSEVGGLM